MIPMPGDWHTLMNFQKAIMKPYFDAGLKSLANAAGYPTASIKACGQFKRVHSFLLETWEAIYRVMVSLFLEQVELQDPLTMIAEELAAHLESLDCEKFCKSVNTLAEVVEGETLPAQPDPLFASNAEETDTRVWLHARKTACTQILILSPDTDVYFIGLPLQCTQEKSIVIQISQFFSRELRLLNASNLLTALRNDPNVAGIEPNTLAKVFQVLYVTTGCDYVSFFFSLGKTTFMKTFFQHAQFITGQLPYTSGTLSDTSLVHERYEQGFLSFLRLVGTTYYKKNAIAFESCSPESHFKSFQDKASTESQLQVHSNWLEDIRQAVWDRITVENEVLPSVEALWRHWKRSCWVLDMWDQADQNPIEVKDISSYGWIVQDDAIGIDWDTVEPLYKGHHRGMKFWPL